LRRGTYAAGLFILKEEIFMCEIEDTVKKFSEMYHQALQLVTEGRSGDLGLEAKVLADSKRITAFLDENLKIWSESALVLALYTEIERLTKKTEKPHESAAF
jgi:hypothetical protein